MSGKKAKKLNAEGHIENYKEHLEMFVKIRDKIRSNEFDQDAVDLIKDKIDEFVEKI